jgi:hypothetical protein
MSIVFYWNFCTFHETRCMHASNIIMLLHQNYNIIDFTYKGNSIPRSLEHLQEFAKFYLTNLVFCQPLKRYVK